MERTEHLEHVRDGGRALISACAAAPEAAVAACPGWTNADLVEHVRMVWGFVAAQVRAADPSAPSRPDPAPEADDALDDLVQLLSSTDPGQPAWNWSPDLTVGFWVRRMASETAIHRWDAEEAAGSPSPIDPDLAADVVDEAVTVMFSYQRRGRVEDHPAASLHLHRTDGRGEWLLVPGPCGLTVTTEHAKADVAVAGTASDLALFVWGRGRGDLQAWGDDGLLDAWASVAP